MTYGSHINQMPPLGTVMVEIRGQPIIHGAALEGLHQQPEGDPQQQADTQKGDTPHAIYGNLGKTVHHLDTACRKATLSPGTPRGDPTSA
jgi:hypothetical protein